MLNKFEKIVMPIFVFIGVWAIVLLSIILLKLITKFIFN